MILVIGVAEPCGQTPTISRTGRHGVKARMTPDFVTSA